MKTRSIVLFLFAALTPFAGAALASHSETLARAAAEIETASFARDAARLDSVCTLLDGVLAANLNDPLAHYYRGYAAYRQANLVDQSKNLPAFEAALEKADKFLARSIQLERTAEALALHSVVLGRLIGVRGVDAVFEYGRKSSAELDEAFALEPQNPRVLLLAGTTAYHKPKLWGGSVDRALQYFQEAAAEFEKESAGAAVAGAPAWGHAEAFAWVGRAYEKKGNIAAARAAYERALAIEPAFRGVTDKLRKLVEGQR